MAAVALSGSLACNGSVGTPPIDPRGDDRDGDDVMGYQGDAGSDGRRRLPDGGVRDLDGGRTAISDGRTPTRGDSAQGGGQGEASTGRGRTDGCPEDAPRVVTKVRLRAAKGQGDQLIGAVIQGSNTGTTLDFVDLAKVVAAPSDGAFTELEIENAKLYRWLKYYAPPGSAGGLAELEFYAGDVKVEGRSFGTVNPDGNHAFGEALDGDASTYFVGTTPGGSYVGLDVGGDFVTAEPTFTPPPGVLSAATDVEISTTTPGAKVRYTLGTTPPSSTSGTEYTAPIRVENTSMSIQAVAYADCYFDSPARSARFSIGTVGEPVTRGLKSYHIGNSLTDTINPWLEPIADSTGVDHEFSRWTMPGTTLGWIWSHRGPNDSGIGTPEDARLFDSWVKTFAPIDHLTLQPYSDPTLDQEGGVAIEMFDAARAESPQLQLWIYDQWPQRAEPEWSNDALANYKGPNGVQPPKPTSWEDAVAGQLRYHEMFRQFVDDGASGKPVRIIPAGLALRELKRQMDAGQIPGLNDFFGSMFQDYIHLNPPAQYLVALVFYACLYQQTPEGHVTFSEPSLTPEQTLAFQRIAWKVASEYRWAGIAN